MMPKIIAHRGTSALAPENTMAAFALALEQGADGIELDAMLCRDGQVVVIHDDTLDRTTNGAGPVPEHTVEELKALDAGDGEGIPTLAEVFERFGGRLLINVELKNYSSIFDRLPLAVAALVRQFDLAESVLVSSFNPFNLPRIRRQLPEMRRGLLTQPGKAKDWVWRLFRFDALHPHADDVDKVLVSALHARGRDVNVWTVDDPDEIIRLADLGVDAIITNDPARTREVLEGCA
jgi:glycerophosphoryl diester phosphodiesterase